MDQLANVKKSIDNVAAAVKELGKSSHPPAGRATVDVDALTDDEVSELARLTTGDPAAASLARMNEKGPALDGMYAEFADLGLVTRAGGGAVLSVSPMAHWAVEKRRQRQAAAQAQLKRQWRHDVFVAVGASAIGGMFSLAGVVLGYFLSPL